MTRVPRELERICLKAMAQGVRPTATAQRATWRKICDTSANRTSRQAQAGRASSVRVDYLRTSRVPRRPWAPHAVRLRSGSCPRGCDRSTSTTLSSSSSFCPALRDRDGLPESLRFWKVHIEATDVSARFGVGLIYGPSGCGKSSLVKAGLLPRLARNVMPIYVEATAGETERRILRGLKAVCPDLPAERGLADCVASLRRGRVLRSGQKVLLILDQFEQWLFARGETADLELVAAMRQCDGEHVQAIVMVRDEFWMAATRFMRELEIRLVEGENSAAVDLFDLNHARRVLTAFGRAYGALPEKAAEITPEQKAFLDQALAGLAQDGKIIPVRLALFAEMVKGKPWTPSSLKVLGGTEGVGVTYLEETFYAAHAPPEHRLHQKAVQAVLKALLPESGTDIKGRMRSAAELQSASGYVNRSDDFADLIHLLDAELRLVTPTDASPLSAARHRRGFRVARPGTRITRDSAQVLSANA